MCTRRVAGLLVLAALLAGPASGAELLARWYDRDDAVLVVVLVDGLRGDMLLGTGFDGQPLMPAGAAWAAGALRLTDVLLPNTEPVGARQALDSALDAFGARRVRRVAPDSLGIALDAAAAAGQREAIVVDAAWLHPPLRPRVETLARLDPAPTAGMSRSATFERQLLSRQRLARSLADPARIRRQKRRGAEPNRDFLWVVESAHADADSSLGALLAAIDGRAPAGRTLVVLTATSGMGSGLRGPAGIHSGAAADMARVVTFLRGPGIEPGTDDAPRAWIGFSPRWILRPAPAERITRAWWIDARGEENCELRWTARDFTLVDVTRPHGRARLYDLRVDPGEWLDRGIALPALADSLRRVLRARLYGKAPVLHIRAGSGEERFALRGETSLKGPDGVDLRDLVLAPGEEIAVSMVSGPTSVILGEARELRIGGGTWLLSSLVLHSPAWQAALRGPPPEGEGPALWLE